MAKEHNVAGVRNNLVGEEKTCLPARQGVTGERNNITDKGKKVNG